MGEYGLSTVLLANGFNLGTLMSRYRSSLDWRQVRGQKCWRHHRHRGTHVLACAVHGAHQVLSLGALMNMEWRQSKLWWWCCLRSKLLGALGLHLLIPVGDQASRRCMLSHPDKIGLLQCILILFRLYFLLQMRPYTLPALLVCPATKKVDDVDA